MSDISDQRKYYERMMDEIAIEHRQQVDQLQAENKKLWELVLMYNDYTSQDRCEGCVLLSRCNKGEVSECWQLTEIRELARELGVEVDDSV